MTVVTVLHPGTMGAEVARLGVQGGATVRWVSSGRSKASRQRAADAGLQECADLHDALHDCDVVLSICPPAHAEDIARQAAGYRGIYVDANAIAPERVHRIAELLPDARVVDGAIIGPPPKRPATTRLYLSGDTEAVANLFEGTALEVVVISDQLGQASALKMAYASYQKASRVLAATAHALANQHGVGEHLAREAVLLEGRPLAEPDAFTGAAARAWRWAPEMLEIATTLMAAGLPADMAAGAARTLDRWVAVRDRTDLSLAEVLAMLAVAPPEAPA